MAGWSPKDGPQPTDITLPIILIRKSARKKKRAEFGNATSLRRPENGGAITLSKIILSDLKTSHPDRSARVWSIFRAEINRAHPTKHSSNASGPDSRPETSASA